MLTDTIPILTDSTLIETVHLITNDTLVIKVQQVASSGGSKSSILDYVLKNGITIVLALIAGMIALYQVKSNVISTARIKWMENLRISLSELCDCAAKTYVNNSNFKKGEKGDKYNDYDKYLESYSKFNIQWSKVKLLLDSNNTYHSKIESLLDKVSSMLNVTNIDTTKQRDLTDVLSELIKLSKLVFREEWKRSKKVFKL